MLLKFFRSQSLQNLTFFFSFKYFSHIYSDILEEIIFFNKKNNKTIKITIRFRFEEFLKYRDYILDFMEFQTFENVNVRNNVYKWIAVFTVFSHAFDFFSSQKNEKVEERTFLYSSNFSLLNIFDFFVYLFPRERANGLLIGKCRCWFRSFFIPASRGVYKVYIEQSSITLPRLRIYRSVT